MAAYREMRPTYAQAVPPGVRFFLIANIALFIGQSTGLFSEEMRRLLALWPIWDQTLQLPYEAMFGVSHFMPWQLLTYGFLHANFSHIFFNLFGLWMFGKVLEEFLGTQRFVTYFLLCIIGAGIVQLLVSSWSVKNGGMPYPTVGASGGLFGLLLAFGVIFPRAHIYLFFIPMGIEARYFVIGYGCLEVFSGLTQPGSSIAHFAHLGGMLFGGLLMAYWCGKLPAKPKRLLYW